MIVPGLNAVSSGCTMLIGRMLQEVLDDSLAANNLLVANSAASRHVLAAMRRSRLTGIGAENFTTQPAPARVQAPKGLGAGRRFVEDVARRLYAGALPSFVSHEDRLYFGFRVSDLKAGQRVVEAEMKRLGFAELSEIGHYDNAAKVGKTFHPRKTPLALTPHCVEVLQCAGLVPA
jgi:hypothetical protein